EISVSGNVITADDVKTCHEFISTKYTATSERTIYRCRRIALSHTARNGDEHDAISSTYCSGVYFR
ncbi:MAG: hypothetical protein LRY43_01100, partial [Gammaproteobacteria bacterium]|nr:hypothetical protein [Gammaproteobacteria bacterium]